MTVIGVGLFVASLARFIDAPTATQPTMFPTLTLLSVFAGPQMVLCWFFQSNETAVFLTSTAVFYSIYACLILQSRARPILFFALGVHAGCGLACFAIFRMFAV